MSKNCKKIMLMVMLTVTAMKICAMEKKDGNQNSYESVYKKIVANFVEILQNKGLLRPVWNEIHKDESNKFISNYIINNDKKWDVKKSHHGAISNKFTDIFIAIQNIKDNGIGVKGELILKDLRTLDQQYYQKTFAGCFAKLFFNYFLFPDNLLSITKQNILDIQHIKKCFPDVVGQEEYCSFFSYPLIKTFVTLVNDATKCKRELQEEQSLWKAKEASFTDVIKNQNQENEKLKKLLCQYDLCAQQASKFQVKNNVLEEENNVYRGALASLNDEMAKRDKEIHMLMQLLALNQGNKDSQYSIILGSIVNQRQNNQNNNNQNSQNNNNNNNLNSNHQNNVIINPFVNNLSVDQSQNNQSVVNQNFNQNNVSDEFVLNNCDTIKEVSFHDARRFLEDLNEYKLKENVRILAEKERIEKEKQQEEEKMQQNNKSDSVKHDNNMVNSKLEASYFVVGNKIGDSSEKGPKTPKKRRKFFKSSQSNFENSSSL